MSLNLRYPNITGMSEKEQIAQIKSYLHQLVDQLNYAPSSGGSESSQTYQAQGAEISYYELRSLIMHDLQQMEKKFEQLSMKMESGYVSKTGWDANKDIVTDSTGNVVAAAHSGGTVGSSGSAVTLGEVTLLAANWSGTEDPYWQVVAISGVTENSQVDLKPSVEQLAIFHDKDLAFVTENDGGVVTVYAIGDKPMNDYTMQVSITEVNV